MNPPIQKLPLVVAAESAFPSDAEALKVLDNSDYVECNNNSDIPYWAPHGMNEGGPSIILDGSFTRLELLAILHFHPKE